MLELGFMKPMAYTAGKTDKTAGVEYMRVSLRDGNYYEIKIHYSGDESSEYFTFRIADVKTTGTTTQGTLTDISCEDITGMWYTDDNARGTIEADGDSGIVRAEILIHIYGSEMESTIIWKKGETE
ncbi:hypothetical protein [Breznakiella homolactica]|uniref:Uncharacterized protein n=1 Tax=Breznakiella homolactica TaxID=2798577 RepID=A0A7T8BA98_9SPIR|nr:hypothetical protein [Breznakiella homolactica]QQO08780.1 hypothetical protein JFL75_17905 [Breznakiella homolactica]